MARQPHYPEDAPVTNESGETPRAPETPDADRKKHLVKAGVAVGIGSAAIVAALLYANRSGRKDR